MQRKEKAAGRVGGETARRQKLVPVGIAGLCCILPEGAQHLPRLRDAGAAFGVDRGEARRYRNRGVAREQRGLERIELRELCGRREIGRVGDVVGPAHEAVEGENRSAVGAAEDEGGDREVLVPGRLRGHPRRGAHRFTRPGRGGRATPPGCRCRCATGRSIG